MAKYASLLTNIAEQAPDLNFENLKDAIGRYFDGIFQNKLLEKGYFTDLKEFYLLDELAHDLVSGRNITNHQLRARPDLIEEGPNREGFAELKENAIKLGAVSAANNIEELDATLLAYGEFLEHKLGINIKDILLEFKAFLESEGEQKRDSTKEIIDESDRLERAKGRHPGDMSAQDFTEATLGS